MGVQVANGELFSFGMQHRGRLGHPPVLGKPHKSRCSALWVVYALLGVSCIVALTVHSYTPTVADSGQHVKGAPGGVALAPAVGQAQSVVHDWAWETRDYPDVEHWVREREVVEAQALRHEARRHLRASAAWERMQRLSKASGTPTAGRDSQDPGPFSAAVTTVTTPKRSHGHQRPHTASGSRRNASRSRGGGGGNGAVAWSKLHGARKGGVLADEAAHQRSLADSGALGTTVRADDPSTWSVLAPGLGHGLSDARLAAPVPGRQSHWEQLLQDSYKQCGAATFDRLPEGQFMNR